MAAVVACGAAGAAGQTLAMLGPGTAGWAAPFDRPAGPADEPEAAAPKLPPLTPAQMAARIATYPLRLPPRARLAKLTPGPSSPPVLQAINAARRRHGLAPVRIDPRLERAAQYMAEDLAAQHTLSHEDSSGARLGERLFRYGYAPGVAVENLASGDVYGEYLVGLWLRSPGHAANLLDPRVCQAGIGHVEERPAGGPHGMNDYWVLDMARPISGPCR